MTAIAIVAKRSAPGLITGVTVVRLVPVGFTAIKFEMYFGESSQKDSGIVASNVTATSDRAINNNTERLLSVFKL